MNLSIHLCIYFTWKIIRSSLTFSCAGFPLDWYDLNSWKCRVKCNVIPLDSDLSIRGKYQYVDKTKLEFLRTSVCVSSVITEGAEPNWKCVRSGLCLVWSVLSGLGFVNYLSSNEENKRKNTDVNTSKYVCLTHSYYTLTNENASTLIVCFSLTCIWSLCWWHM